MIKFSPRADTSKNTWVNIGSDNVYSQPLMVLFLLLVFLSFMQPVCAQGVFVDKKKNMHKLGTEELNQIKVEHQSNKTSWGDCRSYALHKRNRCYRDGRSAYRCELKYDARVKLCDGES